MMQDDEILEFIFSGYIRVQRGLNTISDLIAAYKLVAEGSYHLRSYPDTIRSQLLDLPDIEVERSSIANATTLSREELHEKGAKRTQELTRSEAKVLADRYWPDLTLEEHERRARTEADAIRGRFPGLAEARPEYAAKVLRKLEFVQGRVYLPFNEECAMIRAWIIYGPGTREYRAGLLVAGSRPWVHRWAVDDLMASSWRGIDYAIYVDPLVREHAGPVDRLSPLKTALSERFRETVQLYLYDALKYIHASPAMQYRVHLQWYNPPDVPTITKDGTVDNLAEDGRIKLYHWPRNAEIDEIALDKLRQIFNQNGHGHHQYGRLSNVFLVVEPTCFNSIMRRYRYEEYENDPYDPNDDYTWGSQHLIWSDNMRILAVDPDYPKPNQTYPEGYKGYLWVRLQQLVDKFYEMRRYHPEVGLEQLWLAARESRNEAFVSMDPREARNFSRSQPYNLEPTSLFHDIYYDTANDWVLL